MSRLRDTWLLSRLHNQPAAKRATFFLFTAYATDRKRGEAVTKNYYEESRPVRKIPTKEQLEATARRQAAYEESQQEADPSYSGHSAGIHPEHRPRITDERTSRTRTSASVPVIAANYDLEEDDAYYQTRP